jgi:hypothetical protein
MGKLYSSLNPDHQDFMTQQQIFFVGTAAAEGRVNVSPKGLDALRIISPTQLAWLNLTGSGNETAAHVVQLPRMTLMFCAVAGDPLILRVYGRARAIHQADPEWAATYALFNPIAGARQIFLMEVDSVQTSCGMGVPLYDYRGERNQLDVWAEKKGPDGIAQYWQDKNSQSLDGFETHIVSKQ